MPGIAGIVVEVGTGNPLAGFPALVYCRVEPTSTDVALSLYPRDVPGDPVAVAAAACAWIAFAAPCLALGGAIRLFRCTRLQRKSVGACGVGGRGECGRAADQGRTEERRVGK